ncbi:hypothetical protein AB8A28_11400 [Tardiphaga sp. 71_E8_N1_1]|jgi:hypothetical protein|uniref:hypothetical protein n=1 Tax=Tardiphaga sp. 71_E8_N1_1 TaxID=3240784 RepID=UPI003F8872C6
MPDILQDPLEARLLKELENIQLNINRLNSDKESIERLLLSVRKNNPATSRNDVTRKNSIKRVFVESIIIERLKDGEIHRTFALFTEVKKANPSMNDSTFRSTLRRMKARGLIRNPREGRWLLSTSADLSEGR